VFKTSISRNDHIPAEFLKGVERANTLLRHELLPPLNTDISASWRFVERDDNRIQVLLDLTTPYRGDPVGVIGYPLDQDVFVDDAHIRNGLNRPIWSFNTLLGYLNKIEIKHSRERLEASLTAGAA
jgi:hypothetical protein